MAPSPRAGQGPGQSRFTEATGRNRLGSMHAVLGGVRHLADTDDDEATPGTERRFRSPSPSATATIVVELRGFEPLTF